jgi:hypothetical protein
LIDKGLDRGLMGIELIDLSEYLDKQAAAWHGKYLASLK